MLDHCFPRNLSAVHNIELTLIDGTSILPDNFYRRGTSCLEYGGLANMPATGIAFGIRIVLLNSAGERVLPVFYEDDYF